MHLPSRIFSRTRSPLRSTSLANCSLWKQRNSLWFNFCVWYFFLSSHSANYMAHNNMICHPMCNWIYVFLGSHSNVYVSVAHIFEFNKNSFAHSDQARALWKKEKFLCLFFSVDILSVFPKSNVFIQKKIIIETKKNYALHINYILDNIQCWFNKYASTVGLLLIYVKYTQMPIIILCFDFYCCNQQTVTL